MIITRVLGALVILAVSIYKFTPTYWSDSYGTIMASLQATSKQPIPHWVSPGSHGYVIEHPSTHQMFFGFIPTHAPQLVTFYIQSFREGPLDIELQTPMLHGNPSAPINLDYDVGMDGKSSLSLMQTRPPGSSDFLRVQQQDTGREYWVSKHQVHDKIRPLMINTITVRGQPGQPFILIVGTEQPRTLPFSMRFQAAMVNIRIAIALWWNKY